MKNIFKVFTVIIVVFATTLAFTSCTKTKNELFKGYYTFKTSGTLKIEKKIGDLSGIITETKELTVNLDTENGQMNILSVDNKNGEMIVTMNILNGDILKYDATADKNTLTIDNQDRNVKITDNFTNLDMPVKVSGTGSKYDETVVFDLHYTGTYEIFDAVSKTTYTIKESNINCVARSND